MKSGNMSISSGKFLKRFLRKFLHALSLSGTPTIWRLDLQTNLLTFYPVLFSISLPFALLSWRFFFNSRFLDFYWLFLFMSIIRKFEEFFLVRNWLFYIYGILPCFIEAIFILIYVYYSQFYITGGSLNNNYISNKIKRCMLIMCYVLY